VLDLLYGISFGIFSLRPTPYQIIFSLNSILAWVMKADAAIKLIQKWSLDYIKMECSGEKCYGVLAVYIVSIPFLILGIDCDVARFIESALHLPYSTSFLALPCLVFEILGINELLSRMGE
jgi:Serine incorporator (Serinc)